MSQDGSRRALREFRRRARARGDELGISRDGSPDGFPIHLGDCCPAWLRQERAGCLPALLGGVSAGQVLPDVLEIHRVGERRGRHPRGVVPGPWTGAAVPGIDLVGEAWARMNAPSGREIQSRGPVRDYTGDLSALVRVREPFVLCPAYRPTHHHLLSDRRLRPWCAWRPSMMTGRSTSRSCPALSPRTATSSTAPSPDSASIPGDRRCGDERAHRQGVDRHGSPR